MRAVIGWKSVLYESIERRAELKLSRHLYYVDCTMFDLFRDFFLAFTDNWKWNFGTEASRQVATEESNDGIGAGSRWILLMFALPFDPYLSIFIYSHTDIWFNQKLCVTVVLAGLTSAIVFF